MKYYGEVTVVAKVKQLVLLIVFISVVTFAPNAEAASIGNAQRQEILSHIQTLQAQVMKLEKQLALLQKGSARSTPAEFAYKTKFYKGTYEAVYTVEDVELIPSSGTSVREGDELLFNSFVELAGSSFVSDHISEFRIYNTSSEMSAFVEEKPDGSWILGVNREGDDLTEIYNDPSIARLLIHELSHIVFFNEEPGIEKDFTKKFWSTKQTTNDFVTTYAMKNSSEDIAESFVEFVLRDKPTLSGTHYDKVEFFYDYPQLTKLRDHLRQTDLI